MSNGDDNNPVPIPAGLDWADEPGSGGDLADVRLLDCGDRKISIIRVVRMFTGLGLADSKRLVESAPCVLAEGLSTDRAEEFVAELVAEGAQASTDSKAAATPATDSLVTLVLTETGPQKIAVIKLVRYASGLGLRRAMEIAESTPATISSSMTRENAESFRDRIRAAGGDARIDS